MSSAVCTAGAGRTLHSAKRDENRFSRSAAAYPCLQRGAESSSHNPAAAKCVEGSGDARFVLVALDAIGVSGKPVSRYTCSHA